MNKLYFVFFIIAVAFIAGIFGYMNGRLSQADNNIELERKLESEINNLKTQIENNKEPYLITHKAEIKNRLTRGHAEKQDAWNVQTVLNDYSRIGINISQLEAESIYNALRNYTTPGLNSKMRAAARDYYDKKILDADARKKLFDYSLVIEYSRIAPSYPKDQNLYKGFPGVGEYIKSLYDLKSGDVFKLDMPLNFDTREEREILNAGRDGALLVIKGGVNNGFSLSGFSVNFPDYNVLVSDKEFNIVKVSDDASDDVCRIIYLNMP